MQKSDGNGLTLLAVLIAGALLTRAFPGAVSLTGSLAGLVLLVILFAYEGENRRTVWQSTGFAAVCGFCLLLAASGAISFFVPMQAGGWTFYTPLADSHGESSTAAPFLPALIWIGGSLLFLLIDRSRQSITPAAPIPAPAYQPLSTDPSAEPPAPPSAVPMAPNPSVPANAIPLPLGAGKPATIYINLVGEGLACLRPVQAEHLGRDFYRIVEPVPDGEAWEFQPGQIVRCQKRNLSSGKALVAVEEAPRAR